MEGALPSAFLDGPAEERLSFDHQRRIAELLGYSTRGGLASVERFMKHYFLIAKDVGDLTAIVCAALEERQAKPRPCSTALSALRRRKPEAIATGDFEVENGRVTVTAPDVFAADPVNLIRLFWVADRYGLAIHPDATRHVTQALKLIDANLRANPEANRLFLDILTSRNEPEIVLRLMNEAGVLGRFIPDFGRIVAMMQFNMYHHYTVDEHLLRARRRTCRRARSAKADQGTSAGERDRAVDRQSQSAVSGACSCTTSPRAGRRIIRAPGSRSRARCVRVSASRKPRRRPWPGSSRTIWSCRTPRSAAISATDAPSRPSPSCVQTLERLKMLFVLTVCDIRAVGPGVWNNWKGELLRTLYWETEVVLAGGHSAIDRKESRRASTRRNCGVRCRSGPTSISTPMRRGITASLLAQGRSGSRSSCTPSF